MVRTNQEQFITESTETLSFKPANDTNQNPQDFRILHSDRPRITYQEPQFVVSLNHLGHDRFIAIDNGDNGKTSYD